MVVKSNLSVPAIAGLRDVLQHFQGYRAWVSGTKDFYDFEAGSVLADDGVDVIRPDNILGPDAANPGRWIKNKIDESDLTFSIKSLLELQGDYNAATNIPDLETPAAGAVKKADSWVVTADGLFFTEQVRIGDTLSAKKDDPAVLGDWIRAERNVDLGTETVPGLVEFATDGENAANVAVQGNDARMSNARTPTVHGLGGAEHSTATLAQLNAKVSDATLIDTGDARLSDARTPLAHVHAGSDITSGSVAPAFGGTGLTSYVIGDLIMAAGATILTTLPDVATGNALISGGVGSVFSWGKIGLATHVSGILPIANGGTNAATKTAAFDALSPVTTKGDIIVRNGTNNIRLAVGADDEVLTADAATASGVKWAAAGGGVTLGGAYNFGGAGAGRTINVDASLEVLLTGGGTPPSTASTTLLHIHDSTTTGSNVDVTITSGSAGNVRLNFGDSDLENAMRFDWDNNDNNLDIRSVDDFVLSLSLTSGAVFNGTANAGFDFRVQSTSDTHSVFLDSGTRNFVLAGASAIPGFQSMVRGGFIGDVVTAPTGNPTGGIFVWSGAGEGTARSGGGTVTIWAPNGLHCEACGSDFWTVASLNMNWKSWCFICGVCDAAYKGGPTNVLDQLTPYQNTELIRQTSTWDDVKNLMKLVA